MERWNYILELLFKRHQPIAALIFFFDSLPIFLYPGRYQETEDHNILSPIFYWRELFHIMGGFGIGLLFCRLLSWRITVPIVMMLAFSKEFFMDRPEQLQGWDFKNTTDALCWTAGSFLSSYFLS